MKSSLANTNIPYHCTRTFYSVRCTSSPRNSHKDVPPPTTFAFLAARIIHLIAGISWNSFPESLSHNHNNLPTTDTPFASKTMLAFVTIPRQILQTHGRQGMDIVSVLALRTLHKSLATMWWWHSSSFVGRRLQLSLYGKCSMFERMFTPHTFFPS